jgi:cytoskeletal protein RodZ
MSSRAQPGKAAAPLTLGAELARCRRTRGWSIEVAAQHTKLKPEHLTAIEHDAFEHFASAAHVRGFIRIYARALGLDERIVLAKLDGRPSVDPPEPMTARALEQLPPVERVDVRRAPPVNALVLAGGGALLLLMLAGAWIVYRVGPRNITDSARNATLADTAPKAEVVRPTAGADPAPAASARPIPRAEVVRPVPAPSSAPGTAATAPPPAVTPWPEPVAGAGATVRTPPPAVAPLPPGLSPPAPLPPKNAGPPRTDTGPVRAIVLRPPQPSVPAPDPSAPVIKNEPPPAPAPPQAQGNLPPSPVSRAGAPPRAQLAVPEGSLQLEAETELWLKVVVNGNEDEEAFNGLMMPGQKLTFKGQRFYVKTNQPNKLGASFNGQSKRRLGDSAGTAEFNFPR